MAAQIAEERPDRCQLCGARLAEGAVGFVCEHVAHGAMLTVLADAPSKQDPVPDMLEIEREPGAATATAKAKPTARRAARPRNPRR
jgi:hypothetical protein